MSVQKEKVAQAAKLLREWDIDLWLTFVRETAVTPDPVVDLILGRHVVWQSAFLVSASGESTAIVGSLDMECVQGAGSFDKVIGYKEGIGGVLLDELHRLNPRSILLNFSVDNEIADGLSHGMYLRLMDYLKTTPFADRVHSAERLISTLRGKKTPLELAAMKRAVRQTLELFDLAFHMMRPGFSEKDIALAVQKEAQLRGLEFSWEASQCPAVFVGPDTASAHAGPTDRQIEPGHVINMDFGVKVDGYAADLQRTAYVLRENETEPPEAVQRAFKVLLEAIQMAKAAIKPGKQGFEIDTVARVHIVTAGYSEFPHALGHQVGRSAHDGAALLCPVWERYGQRPYWRLEEGQVYTIEPRIFVEGHGTVTVEEEVVVTPDGAEWLSPPQTELVLLKWKKGSSFLPRDWK